MLLKNSWVELFVLGLAQCSHLLSMPTIMSSMVNLLKASIAEDKLPPIRVKRLTQHIWKLQEFVQTLSQLELDDCEYGYLKIIILFNIGTE